MKKIILVDGNSLMFRAYYATAYTGNLMQARSGVYTNALYGFVNMMQKVTSTEGMTHLFVAFDKGKKTFRHQQYADYKGGRKPMPEEFSMQIPLIKEYLDILDITRLEADEYEADDLIGTMAMKAKDIFDEVIVISGDKDLLQLVGPNVQVHLTKKGITELEIYTKDNFKELMGFHPNQLIDYKGLIGDSSDNLPGISGIGPKTAVKLLDEYQTLENIIAEAPKMKGKTGLTIIAEGGQALRTKALATLCLDAKIDLSLDQAIYHRPKALELRKFYEKVDFYSFIKKLDLSPQAEASPIVATKVETIAYHYHDKRAFLKQLSTRNIIHVEIELDGENYHKANILGIAIVLHQQGFYFDKTELFDEDIQSVLTASSNQIWTIDAKKLYVSLYRLGITPTHITFDVMLAAYIINPSFPSFDVKSVLENILPTRLPYQEEVYGKKAVYSIPEESIYAKYALDKCSYIAELKEYADEILTKHNQLALLYEMEIPLAITLAKVELNGFPVNTTRLQEIGVFLTGEMSALEKQIYDIVGEPFNIGSPKQLGVILFEKLGLGKGKKNKTGYSTSADVLEKLALEHPVPQMVLDYRKYSKLYSTYVVGLMNEIGYDGKLHTTFKQSLTLTGRLSSTEPNIQNIPIRTADGRLIRSAFVPSTKDGWIVSADYSQIELRILAHVSQCQGMMEDFNHGKDLHASTAAKVNHVPLEEVTKDMRRIAKAVNFGIIYGISDWGLAEQLHIRPYEAAQFIEKYFQIYPEIKICINGLVEDAKKLGYSETLYHRRRYMPEISSSNHALRKFAERTAMNAPIQGAAADIMKYAMLAVQNALEEKKLMSKMVAQVHDELILDVPNEELAIVCELLEKTMEQAVQLDVKLDADVEYGKTWDLK